jgi:hypothetical protein
MMIMTTLLDIATSFLRLVEAEGRILKRAVMNIGWALAFIAVATLLVLASVGFFLLGLYQYFAECHSPAAASLIVSVAALVLALVFAGLAIWRTADRK